MDNLFNLKTICVITGASQGFGYQIALDFASKFLKGSKLILIARNETNLENVKSVICNKRMDIEVLTKALDLSAMNDYEKIFDTNTINISDYQQAMIVHNAGSIGPVDKEILDLNCWSEISSYFDLNLTSTIVLTSAFFNLFLDFPKIKKTLINITSLSAVMPLKTWSLYCTGKTARDMLFKVLAAENPGMRVLSYAPGPLNTDMFIIARTKTRDEDVKSSMQNIHDTNQTLSCEESVKKLIFLLEKNEFESGAHMDYYDFNIE